MPQEKQAYLLLLNTQNSTHADITITNTNDTHTKISKQHTRLVKQPHFHLRQTPFIPNSAEHITRHNLQINNTTLDIYKVLGLTLDPKLLCNIHVDNTTVKVSKIIPVLKVLADGPQTCFIYHKFTM